MIRGLLKMHIPEFRVSVFAVGISLFIAGCDRKIVGEPSSHATENISISCIF